MEYLDASTPVMNGRIAEPAYAPAKNITLRPRNQRTSGRPKTDLAEPRDPPDRAGDEPPREDLGRVRHDERVHRAQEEPNHRDGDGVLDHRGDEPHR